MLGIIDWIVIGMFGAFCGLDMFVRARAFDEVRGWRLIGVLAFVVNSAIATYAPFLWDDLFGRLTLVDASALPLPLGVLAGFLVYQFGVYVWHRTMHNVSFLWRWVHQMHHSAERVDIYGAYYFHPFDMVGWALLGSVMLVGILGISPGAAAFVIVLASFCSMFQHANIRTPRWLGYIVTRPESHSVHHERSLHAYNYGDIPLFDMLFGTFRNPREWDEKAGFFAGSTSKFVPLLLGREVA